MELLFGIGRTLLDRRIPDQGRRVAGSSSIEWTNATWNPVTGCDKVSQGCKHCYAERMAKRLHAMGNPRYANGFALTLHPDQPLLKDFRRKPMPILGEDPQLTMLQDFDRIIRVAGHPGPPTPAAAEVESNWIIGLTIGRAVQSNVDDAVGWAASRIEQIYRKHSLA